MKALRSDRQMEGVVDHLGGVRMRGELIAPDAAGSLYLRLTGYVLVRVYDYGELYRLIWVSDQGEARRSA